MQRSQQAAGKKIIFVGAARVGHDQLNGHNARRIRLGNDFRIIRNIPAKLMQET
jgi:hypothetical protein